jgi:hypothetical protein
MKKLLGILVLGLLLSGNAYAEIITLDCKSLMEETPQNLRYQTIKINTKEKYIDTGFGINSPIVEETDEYFKAKHYGSDGETVHIDRYTGVLKIISISNVNGEKKYSLFDHLKCEKTKKKF